MEKQQLNDSIKRYIEEAEDNYFSSLQTKNKMNKFTGGLATLIILLIFSCTKEDKEYRIFQITDIIGLWEQTGGNYFVSCPNGNNARIEITETEYKEYFANTEGCLTMSSLSRPYKFDGEVIYTWDGLITLRVINANANSLLLSDGKQTISYSKLVE